MLRKLRRRIQRESQKRQSGNDVQRSALKLENLENRLLLDSSGYWSELGWRSGSGGGVTWDIDTDQYETEMVISSDGDPIVFWVEGNLEEYVPAYSGSSVEYFQSEGAIYARQYGGEDIGWWDMADGGTSLGTGSQLDADSGPNDTIVVAWASGGDIQVSHWDGSAWASLGLETLGNAAQKPSVAISQLGEIFVSYTTVYPEPGNTNPNAGQREIVVQKYGFTYDTDMVGPPQVENMGWTEIHNADVEDFMQSEVASTGGVSNDSGQSFDSSITVDQYGRPVVVWTDFTNSSNSEIFLKRWDGDSWEEMGLGSASDPDSDVNFGVSSDSTVSVQPDVAVAPNGDVIVTWVNWNNWADKTADGQAGIFVKTLPKGSNEWESYAVGSATGAGISQDSALPVGSMGQGWYFSPKIDIDSNGYPLICWQGYGVGERFSANRDGDLIVESPMAAVFVSHYDGTEFNVLHNTDNARGTSNDPDFMAWMPAVAVGNNDQFFMAYTWHDEVIEGEHLNDEIFAQVWDAASNSWTEFGRGSMSSGNDVFGGYPLGIVGEQIQPQVALIDYSTSSSLDLVTAVPNLDGINDGHIYLYNRLTGQWTTDVDTIEFGNVFDIKGEPETEYGVAGKPLLAYLDDVTGLPYVYEYLPGGWSLIEGDGTGGAVADVAGMLAEADPSVYNNAGISVQAGPDGQVLLAYVKEVGASQLVTTYLWDPDLNDGSWTSMGNVPQIGGLQAVYYADFSGYDWDIDGDLSDGEANQNGRIYAEEGAWYFWDQNNNGDEEWDLVNGTVFVGTGKPGDDNYEPGAGRQWITFNDKGEPIYHEGGILITAAYEEDESEIAETFVSGTVMYGEVDHQFRLIEDSHVIVQMMYDMDSLNMDEHLYLVLDGEVIDVDPTDSLAITPIDSIKAGQALDYDANGFFVFDSKLWAEASSPEEPVLAAGLHTVGVRSLSEITMPNLKYGFPNEEPAPADPVVIDGWTVSPDGTEPAVTALSWGAAFGLTGADDGGIQMAFDDSLDPTIGTPQKYTASFSQDIYLARGGDVRIELDLEMDAIGTLDSDDTLEFRVLIDGNPVTDALETVYLVTGDAGASNADIAYATIAVDTTSLVDGLAVGAHTISLEGVYTDGTDNPSGAGPVINLDNVKVSKIDRLFDYMIHDSFDATPEAMGWLYADVPTFDPDGTVDGGYLAGANLGDAAYGGGLVMTLGETNTTDLLSGLFMLDFEMGGPIKLSFDYQLDLSDEVDVDEFLTLVVAIDNTLITSPVDTANLADDDPNKDLEYISLAATAPSAGGTGDQDTGTIEIELNDEQEIAALQALYSGGHQLVIQGILSNGADVEAGAGTGTVTIDNVSIVGTHQTHGRVDNFTVYQHVVAESYAAGPDRDDFSADPSLISEGANAADQWRFSEVDPDSIVQPLYETGVVQAEWDGTGESLVLTLGDNVSSNGVTEDGAALSGNFDYVFNLVETGDLQIDLGYQMLTGASIADTDTLSLTVAIDGTDLEIGTYKITGGGQDSGMNRLVIDVAALENGVTYAAGLHTLSLTGTLTNSAVPENGVPDEGTARLIIDNVAVTTDVSFDTDPTVWDNTGKSVGIGIGEGWSYQAATENNDAANGIVNGWDDDPATVGNPFGSDGGALCMTLGDGATATVGDGAGTLDGYFSYFFTLDEGAYATVDMSYLLLAGATVPAGATLDLSVELVSLGFFADTEFQSDLGLHQVVATGAGVRGSAWQDIVDMELGGLDAGSYELRIHGYLSESSDTTSGFGIVMVDDFELDITEGLGTWESTPSDGNNGGNNEVGPRNDKGVARYTNVFKANIHSELQDGGDQSYTIYDVQKEGEGDLMVSFRYSYAEMFDFGSGEVSIVAVDTTTGEMISLTDPVNSLENHSDDWWDWDDEDNPHYNWVRAEAQELGSGTYDIKIIFSDEAGGFDSSNFWIDDLSILASQRSSTIRPQTILSSINIGQDGTTRPFAVGVTSESPGLKVYAGAGLDEGADLISPYPDGTINANDIFDFPELKSAHYSANIFELIDGTWQLFGTGLSSDTNIDFLGLSASEPGVMYGMPGSELYQLTDLVIGPNQLIWASVQHATTDFVDPVGNDNSDEKTRFDVHAFMDILPPDYWNVGNPGTDLDIEVWRWVSNWDPGEVPVGTEAAWEVLDIALPQVDNAYTNIQMVVTPEGAPMIGWSYRDFGGGFGNSGVIRYEGEAGGVPVWGTMGNLGDVQNDDYWSASFLYDMVVTPDGKPVVNYNMLHLESYGVREFISEASTPEMVITERPSADVDVILDNALHFGSTVDDKLFREFIIENTGNADLVVFDISMDGFGDVSSDVFKLENFSQFPITLEPGDLKSVRVSFDPTVETVSPGIYDGVMLIQSNVPDNPILPISQYYEMTMHTEVLDQSEVYVDPNEHQWLNFSKTLINGGVSEASGLFQQDFTVGSAREVNLQFDYRLLLAEQLQEGQTLELFITLDGERITLSDPSAYEIVGGVLPSNSTNYLPSDNISLGELAAGKHSVEIGVEITTPTQRGIGGIGTLRLDNIVLNGTTYSFDNSPRQNNWSFQTDTNNPQVTTGYWNDNVGKTGDGNGGLEMILGQEVQEIVVSNIGTEDMVIYEWMFEGVSFRTLTDTDGISGAYISWTDTLGTLKTEMIPSYNYHDTSDDVTLAPGRDLHLQVVFEPTEVVASDETFYIHLSDSDEGVVPIRLSGMGLSGSDFLITAIYDGNNEVSVSTDDTGEIDFGSVIKGQSEIVTVTIFNTGTSDLTITSLHSNGGTEITFDPSSILNEAIDPIVPGGAWSFNVIYTPAMGSVGDTTIDELLGEELIIITDAPVLDQVVTIIELAGLGVPEIPVISLVDTETGEPFDFNQVNFGTSHVGVPIEKTFNIENIGGAALTIDHIRLIGDDGSYFTFTPNDNGPNNSADDDIIPFKGNAIPVTVLFTPTDSEYYNDAQIQVFYMDENSILRKAELSLVGRGTIQEIEITDTQGAVNDSQVDYGQVGLNRTSESQTITLTNSGDGSWTINTISVVGGDVFSLVDDFSAIVLDPGESYDFDVQFTPEAIASFADSIKIESTDPDSAPVDFFVTLLGLGVAPGELVIFNDDGEAITYVDFGENLALQTRLYESIEIRNNGDDAMRIEGIEVYPFTQNFSLSHTLDSADENEYFDLLPGVPLPLTVSFISPNFFDSSQATPPLVVRITTSDASGDPQFTDVALMAKSIFAAESSDIPWYDGSELVARIIVSGGGTAMVTPVSDSDFSIGSIQLSDTGSKTTLKVIGLVDDVTVGNITGGVVKSVVLKNITLNGDIDLDGAVSLQLDDVIDGADIDIDQVLGKPVKITAGEIGDGTDIDVAGSVTRIKADSYGSGQITAESIKTITIKGDFGASIDVDGELRTLNVKGQSVSGDINVGERFNKFNARNAGFDGSITAESIGAITVDSLDNVLINTRSQLKQLMVMGDMSGSHVLAGLDLGSDNLPGGIGSAQDTLYSSGDIRNVNVKGEVSGSYIMAGISANSLGNFNVFEGDGPVEVRSGIIGTVRLGDFDSLFGTPYGVASRDIGRVKVDGSPVDPGSDLGDIFYVEEF